LTFFTRIFGSRKRSGEGLVPLYTAIVAEARDPAWYRDGQVPDTLDGRFDMIAALLTLVLLRLETAGLGSESVALTETFIADMDGSVRQMGIGDMMVGKHVGRMVSALGGRLSAFRAAGDGSLEPAVVRNIFHEAPPSPAAVAFVTARLERFRQGVGALPPTALLDGKLAA
jgi:cytochrome b pre-mRNA-processing protein 3